jgi:hypothetical protein
MGLRHRPDEPRFGHHLRKWRRLFFFEKNGSASLEEAERCSYIVPTVAEWEMGIEDRSAFSGFQVANQLLMDVARRIQLTPTKHDQAVTHFNSLCEYVDRVGSPLEGLVVRCYGTGSFGIGAAVASRVKSDQHDVDAVMEVEVPADTPPSVILRALFEAINGEAGSRYCGKVKLNSRCVTVHYDDGVTVDLMPIARFPSGPERAGNLFHYRPEAGESYHKPVNPFAFKEYFNSRVELDPAFAKDFRASASVLLEKAETEPIDDHVPLEEKSPRVVALQLEKRFRDIQFRSERRKGMRKPPSVVLAAMALELPPARPTLLEELIDQSEHIRDRLIAVERTGQLLRIPNPAYPTDVFTDRWPKSLPEQRMFANDLDHLASRLKLLAREVLSPTRIKFELEQLFGETAAEFAVGSFLEHRLAATQRGAAKFSTTGKIVTGTAAAASSRAAARPSTHFGEAPPAREDD